MRKYQEAAEYARPARAERTAFRPTRPRPASVAPSRVSPSAPRGIDAIRPIRRRRRRLLSLTELTVTRNASSPLPPASLVSRVLRRNDGSRAAQVHASESAVGVAAD